VNRNYVGICLPNYVYNQLETCKPTDEENILMYEHASELYDLPLCFFQWRDISPDEDKVRALIKTETGYSIETISIPRVIINRTMTNRKSVQNKINRLSREGKYIFNSFIRDDKYLIHNLLMKCPCILPHLPETLKATEETIRSMMEKHDKLFIKPSGGSLGKGIMTLEKINTTQWCLTYPMKKRFQKAIFSTDLPDVLLKRIRKRVFLVQQSIPLAKYQGRPFDIRVHIQRDNKGKWAISGILLKVAPANHYLTNVGHGSKVTNPKKILHKETVEAIASLAKKVASHLASEFTHLAEMGFDIGINKEGFPYFIESNFRPHRYGFQALGMKKEWELTYLRPFAYARYLLQQAALDDPSSQ